MNVLLLVGGLLSALIGIVHSVFGTRAKHFSWWVFLIIATLLWLGSSN